MRRIRRATSIREITSRRSLASRSSLLAALVTLASVGPASAQEAATTFQPEELEQVVAPIALYPDALLAQVLMASTYPLEVVEAARWQQANPNLKDKALEDALQKQTWDASVKSLAAFPQVLTMMNDKLDWTQKLGDAFLAQQKGVMDAVQRLRAKAKAEGNLETTKEQKVIVEAAPAGSSTTTVIQVVPASPQVVYVPTYNPTVVYGAWPYPAYPPYSYYPPGYVVGASLFSFGVGMAVGSAMWGNCNWGHGDVDINVNQYNNFNKTNISNKNWNHNVDHRKGVQYRDKATQQQYGKGNRQSAATRDEFRGRAEQGRQQMATQGTGAVQRDLDRAKPGGAGAGSRPGASQRPGGAGSQTGLGSQGTQRPSTMDRGAGSPAFQGDRSGSQARRDSSRGHASQRSAASRGSGGGSRGGFSGGGGSRGGGGGSRGGGGGRR